MRHTRVEEKQPNKIMKTEKKILYSSCKDMRDVVAFGSLSRSSARKNATEICLNYNAKGAQRTSYD